MKKVYLYLSLTSLIACIITTSCRKVNSVDPTNIAADSTSLSFGVQTDGFAYTLASKPATGNLTTNSASLEAFTWTGGTANISKFKLNATRDGVAQEIVSNNLTNLDLFALSPLLSKVNIKKGLYKNVTLSMVLNAATATTGKPITLNGTFTTGAGTRWPVEFDFNESVEVKVALADITVDGTKNLVTKINMHLNKFLNSITAQQIDAATRTNGTIIISSTSNVNLYNLIKANFLTSVESVFQTTVK